MKKASVKFILGFTCIHFITSVILRHNFTFKFSLFGTGDDYTLTEIIINKLWIVFTCPLLPVIGLFERVSEDTELFLMLGNSFLCAVIALTAYRMLRKLKRGRTRNATLPQ